MNKGIKRALVSSAPFQWEMSRFNVHLPHMVSLIALRLFSAPFEALHLGKSSLQSDLPEFLYVLTVYSEVMFQHVLNHIKNALFIN